MCAIDWFSWEFIWTKIDLKKVKVANGKKIGKCKKSQKMQEKVRQSINFRIEFRATQTVCEPEFERSPAFTI